MSDILTLRIRCAAGMEAEHEVIDSINMVLLTLVEQGFIDDRDDEGWRWGLVSR